MNNPIKLAAMPITYASQPALYDLHMHTGWSYDATAKAEDYFRMAQKLGVRCIAITEHHNIDSVAENLQIAEKYPDIQFIIAAELSVTTSIGAVDLLCYKLPQHPTYLFAQVLLEYREWQRAAGQARSAAMVKMGIPYDDAARLELLRIYRPPEVIEVQGATHVANGIETEFFMKQGYVKSPEERGELMRRSGIAGPAYPAVEHVTRAVKEAGGLIAIAHPTGYFNVNDTKRMDLLREECLLDGIECAHPTVTPELTEFYRRYCVQHDLFSTGGSDSHHLAHIQNADLNPLPEGEKAFAHHIGEASWLDEFLERIG